ncbi:MAG: hypothetical protein U0Y08_09320 [Bacteroidia bacterium]
MAKVSPLYYFTLVMSSLYIVLGLIVMFTPQVAEMLPGWKHWTLGLMLIAYAFFRFKRLKAMRKTMENES